MDWRTPNKSDCWQSCEDFIMFIDENNSVSSINIVQKRIRNKEEISPNENFFTITGCIFSKVNYINAENKFDKLRKKYWKEGKYYNSKKEIYEVVCFHSEDIRGRKKAFHSEVLDKDNYDKFIVDLDKVRSELDYTIISISINLEDYLLKSHYTEMNVYKIAFNFIIERFIYYIGNRNKGSIIFEARGKKEDGALLEHIDKIINHSGTEFIKSKELKSKVLGVYFNGKKDKNDHPYTGLEIADLSSYPIHRYIKFNTIGRDFETIKHKINGYPNDYKGKGIKIYPKK